MFIFNKCLKKLFFSVKARIIVSLVLLPVIYIIFRLVSSVSCAEIIALQDIPDSLVPSVTLQKPMNRDFQLCDIMTILGNGSWPISSVNISDDYLNRLAKQTNVEPGGAWKPKNCISQHHVAIIVPYRDRPSQLRQFLAHMHPFLQFQKLSYQIFIIDQTEDRPFNRAKLFNIGFKEAENVSNFHCYIFHDVDLLPLNVHNVYGCTKVPRHLSANIDIFDYKVPYDWIFGGAVSILRGQFISVNGFSNKFFGWGGEDDDFFNRVTKNGSKICRFEPEVSKYMMLTHKKETPNEDRYFYLASGMRRYMYDGLNSLKYSVKSIDFEPLFMRVLVDL